MSDETRAEDALERSRKLSQALNIEQYLLAHGVIKCYNVHKKAQCKGC